MKIIDKEYEDNIPVKRGPNEAKKFLDLVEAVGIQIAKEINDGSRELIHALALTDFDDIRTIIFRSYETRVFQSSENESNAMTNDLEAEKVTDIKQYGISMVKSLLTSFYETAE